ncbi:MAG: hypothetical protein L3J35_00185 [Bacteroidales bacterium]|nr:hypothetical protein [Bacteroidales bacterium]
MKKINFFVIATLFIGSFFVTSCNEPSDEEVQAQADEIINSLNDLADETADNDETAYNTSSDKYHSVDGRFKVNFSGTPDVSNESVPTDVGNIEMYMFMYEKSITEAEMIAYSDYPSAMVKASNPDDMLQGAKEGAVGNLGATIVEEKEITYGKHKGLEFRANSPQFYVNYRIFLVNNRLYQIAIMRDGSFASQSNVDKFFNSFELIEKE